MAPCPTRMRESVDHSGVHGVPTNEEAGCGVRSIINGPPVEIIRSVIGGLKV